MNIPKRKTSDLDIWLSTNNFPSYGGNKTVGDSDSV